MTEKQILKALAGLNSEANELRRQLDEVRARKKLTCGFCGKKHAVSKLTLIQTHWYVQPYGCTGGDYWKRGERQYECPSCGRRMRECDADDRLAATRQFDPKIAELAPYFGAKVDKHK